MGLGSAPLGGLFAPVSDGQAHATIVRALELGVRHIDTAPFYGQGLAEERVGATLRRLRSPVTLSTKVGRVVVPGGAEDGSLFQGGPPAHAVFDFSAEGVMRSIEDSLGRLGVDKVDILLIHVPDDHPDAALADAYPTLARLRRQGSVGAIGVGMNQTQLLTRFVLETDVDCIMIAGRYTLLDQSAATITVPHVPGSRRRSSGRWCLQQRYPCRLLRRRRHRSDVRLSSRAGSIAAQGSAPCAGVRGARGPAEGGGPAIRQGPSRGDIHRGRRTLRSGGRGERGNAVVAHPARALGRPSQRRPD